MNVQFAQEPWIEAQPEFAVMLHTYWDTAPQNAGHIPLDMDWQAYENLSQSGALHLTVGRQDGKMIAAAIYFVFNHLHHKTVKVAHSDIFAVDIKHRGYGVGRALYRAAEIALIADGVQQITNLHRVVYGVAPMFKAVGMHLEELVYLKKVA